jgi:hyperosmotically inducible protein
MNKPMQLALSSLIFACAAQSALAQSNSTAMTPNTTVPADNSKSNKFDQNKGNATADAQKDDKNDVLLTQNIRKSVMADKSLSTYAHNVKIVAVNGTVTLNGVVRSDQEKSSVEMKAAAVAGQDHVVNDLKVSPSK